MKTKAQITNELKNCFLQSQRLATRQQLSIDQEDSVEYRKLDDRCIRLIHRIGVLCWVLDIDPDNIGALVVCHCGREAKWLGSDNSPYCGLHARQFSKDGKTRIDSERGESEEQ